jgi:hypothetical protein
MKLNDIFLEANIIGSSIYKNQIPEKYKKYPIIGRGSTSIVLEKDQNSVFVLTRDGHKKDWLVHGLEIAEWIDTIDAYHPNKKINELPIYILIMPKLKPLSPENKRKTKKEIKLWLDIHKNNYWKSKRQYALDLADFMQQYLEIFPNGLFSTLFDHLSNYDMEHVSLDLLLRNFMEDSKGNIILVDPVVDQEIISAFRG